ncbi:MAG: hypothetical protein CTY15_01450 [Methylocystis sp.]|nr:MAG: hypothetical protein CTY15_01450 [Methylocystis sp.]
MKATWREIGRLAWRDIETQTVHPLSAGSGLVAAAGALWVAADDMHHVVRLPENGDLIGDGYRIFPGDLPEDAKERKRVKPDTECLIALETNGADGILLALPSGSKRHRVRGAEIQVREGVVRASREIDLSPLLKSLDEEIPDLNIEGGAIMGDKVVLLQRGNGKAGFNALIEFDLDRLGAWLHGGDGRRFKPRIAEMRLPKMGGVRLTFTDAAVHEGALYFAAAAEGGDSTYDDGKIIGSAIGRIDKEPDILIEIEGQKVEGLAHASSDADRLTFFAVTDADDPARASSLLEIGMARFR